MSAAACGGEERRPGMLLAESPATLLAERSKKIASTPIGPPWQPTCREGSTTSTTRGACEPREPALVVLGAHLSGEERRPGVLLA